MPQFTLRSLLVTVSVIMVCIAMLTQFPIVVLIGCLTVVLISCLVPAVACLLILPYLVIKVCVLVLEAYRTREIPVELGHALALLIICVFVVLPIATLAISKLSFVAM